MEGGRSSDGALSARRILRAKLALLALLALLEISA
jgi:hypothetical protein